MPISYKHKIYTTNGWLTSYKRKLYMGRTTEWNQQRTKDSMDGNGAATVQYDTIGIVNTNIVYGHKYYVSLYIKYDMGNTNTSNVLFKMGDFSTNEFYISMSLTNEWARYEKIDTLKSVAMPTYLSGFQKFSTADQILSIKWKNIQIFDLTQMFGAGNEPSTPAEFWSYFDHKLYPYNAGETQPLFKISRKSQWGIATETALYVGENIVIPQTVRN